MVTLRRLGLTSAVVLASLLAVLPGAASASQPAASDAHAASASQNLIAAQARCGFRYVNNGPGANSAWWRNCSNVGTRLNVDRAFYPDFTTCVPANSDRRLGAGNLPVGPGAIRGASIIGTC
ncbi:hypothetical protein Ae706Ps2_6472 [Pseudonocardia sp. Ae706_Ps2]|nr:hypothetical protein Ae331Ps2_6268c [Pseudonocardia sp. Ae331_Ps2]OLM08355.1 hypothetical protein Ae505Ps2_6209c [Pseudonocardia sp. Ae505_Ps2]OLM09368.1 hypothetical protein Ae706Ps2_6468 [Pseudonocardia sp. Ae706_Ps2]OLM09370.1 hypothetical protein Ae706Ps2_6470 [Pseudonocardia sp. Ae706_Ps2]OLM09372.1 hypothetical protein Ae706Ps2_6472 [Pseudonocardia sp. Ae706_Ps2]